MKKIMIPIMLFMLTACNSNKEVPPVEAKAAPATEEVAATDSTKVDGTTGATSKANQISFNGTIIIPPQCMVTVSLTMGGVVKSTSLLPGQAVTKGNVLAVLENPDFIALQQNYLDSYAQTEYLEAEYQRQNTLSAEQAASKKRLQQSKADYLSMKSRMAAAAAQLRILGVAPEILLQQGIQQSLSVKAPISGYVTDVEMNVGKYMNAGEALCEVVDKSHALLKLTAYEKDLANMKVGSSIEFRVNGMGTQSFRATLVTIGQKVDKVNRSVEIFGKIDTMNPLFRPGMYITARILK